MSAHQTPHTQIIQVLVPKPFPEPFDYKVPQGLIVSEGQYVQVSFGKQKLWGVVWKTGVQSSLAQDKIKEILSVSNLPPISKEVREFLIWTAGYTLAPLGSVLKMLLSVPDGLKTPKQETVPEPMQFHPCTLNEAQALAGQEFRQSVKDQSFKTFVLEGVTGSGKTEVYFEGIKEAFDHGQQSLVLVPEISLSTQWVERFQKRFGVMPTLWHSDLTPKQRRVAWRAIADGTAKVIIGARSALFLPYKNLGYIVVDEEHDHSYKQETGVIYQARDLAVMRALKDHCPVVLSSATPSLETLQNIDQGKYIHLHLPERHGVATMPTLSLIDMRQHKTGSNLRWISKKLQAELVKTLERGEQSLLFLNRRGYAPLLICHACGHHVECPNCSTWLVYHKAKNILQCHHCQHHRAPPRECPECEELDSFSPCGPGVERIAEEVENLFPSARVMLMTSDTLSTSKKARESIQAIQNREVDIIIGTQVMAKGHHFPYLTCVGVIDGDIGLSGGDLRASEKTYQLLHQVGGRAGRSEFPGSVFIQTHCPEHPVMQSLIQSDHKGFLALETQCREQLHLPPFGKLASLIVSGKNAETTEQFVNHMASLRPHHPDVDILGPSPAPLHQLHKWYRWRFLVKVKKHISPQKVLTQWLEMAPCPSTIKITVDIDPYSFF